MKTLLLILSLLSFSCIAQEGKKGTIRVKKVAKDTTLPVLKTYSAGELIVIGNWMVQSKPEFPGGNVAMAKFIKDNLVYPPARKEPYKNGYSDVAFTIGLDGSISNIKIARGLAGCPECDKEAIRIIKLMPQWKPAIYYIGPTTPYQLDIPVEFKFK